MKEINEIMQMRIFDLLEGNLNAKDAAELQKEIEQDSALKREFDLMSKTYLPAENIVFAGKQSLYKKRGLFIQFSPVIKYAAAACVVLLFGSISVFWFNKTNTKVDVAKNAESPLKKEMQTNNKSTSSSAEFKPGKSNPATVQNRIKSDVKKFILPVITDEKIENDNSILEPQKFNGIAEVEADNTPVTPVISSLDSHAVNEIKVPVSMRKRRSLSYRLLNGSRQMLANLQLPEVKFTSEKNSKKRMPTIKMKISTPTTAIIATLIE